MSKAFAWFVIGSVTLLGCGAPGAQDRGSDSTDLGASQQALVTITNCTAANILAAVAAGGDVVLSCGSSPITVTFGAGVTVSAPTTLRSTGTGAVTFSHPGVLFDIATGSSFSLANIALVGTSMSSTAVHAVGASASISDASLRFYSGFAVSVHNGSHLTVARTLFSDNGVGTTNLPFAGSIYNEGSTTDVSDSTFSNDHSIEFGGAIVSFGQLTVNRCTFTGNSAAIGGAIYFRSNATLSVTNSTFSGNSATNGAAAIDAGMTTTASVNGATFSENHGSMGTVLGTSGIFNSIIVDSSPRSGTCSLFGSGNIQWPATTPLCGAGFRFADPKLAALANNGGFTQTMSPLPGSAAIDALSPPCSTSSDQRGAPRPLDGDFNGTALCDVGAVER